MGSVLAAESQKPAASAASTAQTSVPEVPKFSPTMPTANFLPESDALPNPGTFEDLFKKVKGKDPVV